MKITQLRLKSLTLVFIHTKKHISYSLLIVYSRTCDAAIARYRPFHITQYNCIIFSFITLSMPSPSHSLSFALIKVEESVADEFRIWKVTKRNSLRIHASKTKEIRFHRLITINPPQTTSCPDNSWTLNKFQNVPCSVHMVISSLSVRSLRSHRIVDMLAYCSTTYTRCAMQWRKLQAACHYSARSNNMKLVPGAREHTCPLPFQHQGQLIWFAPPPINFNKL